VLFLRNIVIPNEKTTEKKFQTRIPGKKNLEIAQCQSKNRYYQYTSNGGTWWSCLQRFFNKPERKIRGTLRGFYLLRQQATR
jgi:N-glycosylase/DNA lyase